MKRHFAFVLVIVAILVAMALPRPAPAYIGGPPLTLGNMCAWSTHVMIARIEGVDENKTAIVFRKVRDVKGKWPTETFRHFFNPNFPNRQHIFDWVEPGKQVVICALESYKWCHTYIDKEWYAANTPDWTTWNVSHSEPLLLRMFAGKSERLVDAVTHIVAGKEVVVPAMMDGPLEILTKRQAKYQRVIASMKRLDYNEKRDFVSLGNDDFSPLAGMPGFTHSTSLGRFGNDVHGIVSADFDGDGKLDLLLVGSNGISLQLNGGDYFNEVILPGLTQGCSGTVAADYNGDGKADLLLTTAAGPRLYTNLGQGVFRDDTALLPKDSINAFTAAAWIDFDGDGKPDILLANGYHGLRLYRNRGLHVIDKELVGLVRDPAHPDKLLAPVRWFEDVSAAVGLGPDGAANGIKGETLTVCDVNGDGRPDFLFGAGTGMLFVNTTVDKPKSKCETRKFELVEQSGISFAPSKIGPVFGDFNGDGCPDLFVPQDGQCRLFLGDGKGRFTDVSAKALPMPIPGATSAAVGDVNNDGKLDLVVGCLRGTNRFLRNRGDGTFEDAGEEIGLHRKIYNSQAVCLADLNGDGTLDMIFNNENQNAVVLLGNPSLYDKRVPVMVHVTGPEGVIGSRVQVHGAKGLVLATQEISGGAGRHQPPAQVRFALEPGNYRVQVRFSSGKVREQDVAVVRQPVRLKIEASQETP